MSDGDWRLSRWGAESVFWIRNRSHVGRNNLDDDSPLQPYVLGDKYPTHPSACELVLETECAGEFGLERRRYVRLRSGVEHDCGHDWRNDLGLQGVEVTAGRIVRAQKRLEVLHHRDIVGACVGNELRPTQRGDAQRSCREIYGGRLYFPVLCSDDRPGIR